MGFQSRSSKKNERQKLLAIVRERLDTLSHEQKRLLELERELETEIEQDNVAIQDSGEELKA